MTQVYAIIAQAIYLFSMLVALAWAAFRTATNLSLLKGMVQKKHLLVFGLMAFFYLGGAIVGGGAVALGEIGFPMYAALFIIGAGIPLVIAVACYPAAVQMQRPPRRGDFCIARPDLYVLIGITWAWSIVSVFMPTQVLSLILGREIKLEIIDGGLADIISQSGPVLLLAFTLFALLAAIVEEVIFRGGLQEALKNWGLPPWLAIVLVSICWMFGHGAGYVTPHGIKEIQVLGLGLIFGYTKERYGLGAAMALHLANNGGAMILQVIYPMEI